MRRHAGSGISGALCATGRFEPSRGWCLGSKKSRCLHLMVALAPCAGHEKALPSLRVNRNARRASQRARKTSSSISPLARWTRAQNQVLGHGGAVPGAVDVVGAVVGELDGVLVLGVLRLRDEAVAERHHREVEVFGRAVAAVALVDGDQARGIPALDDALSARDGVGADPPAGLVEGRRDGEDGVLRLLVGTVLRGERDVDVEAVGQRPVVVVVVLGVEVRVHRVLWQADLRAVTATSCLRDGGVESDVALPFGEVLVGCQADRGLQDEVQEAASAFAVASTALGVAGSDDCFDLGTCRSGLPESSGRHVEGVGETVPGSAHAGVDRVVAGLVFDGETDDVLRLRGEATGDGSLQLDQLRRVALHQQHDHEHDDDAVACVGVDRGCAAGLSGRLVVGAAFGDEVEHS